LDALFPTFKTFYANGQLLDLSGTFNAAISMGILNVTPDSFFEGSRINSVDAAVQQAEKMILEGVTIIDVGGHSTRPGADPVSEQEEISRVIPIINALGKRFPDLIISIDTYRLSVAKAAFAAGAHILNDIGGGQMDVGIFDWICSEQIPYVLTHSVGKFEEVHQIPAYENVVDVVWTDLAKKVQYLRSKGLKNLLIDPGFGFSKSLDHNYDLLSKLSQFKLLGAPILVGLSRKTMIHKFLHIDADQSLNGSTALHAIALNKGASVMRVHDVKEAMEVIKLVHKLKQYGVSDICE
jgi:dihydropteroate synthase